jgi:hypothetical protein
MHQIGFQFCSKGDQERERYAELPTKVEEAHLHTPQLKMSLPLYSHVSKNVE